MKKHKKWKKSLKDFSSEVPNSIFMIRPPFRKEITQHMDLSNAVWVYSMWKGYLEKSEPLKRLQKWTEENEIPFIFIHTSGHAKMSELKRLSESLSPDTLIPIHSYHAEMFSNYFKNVKLLSDGESILI